MMELFIYLVFLDGSWVNFHQLSVDPIDVKFVSVILMLGRTQEKYEICCLILFNRVS
jgi:hypothetical protein